MYARMYMHAKLHAYTYLYVAMHARMCKWHICMRICMIARIYAFVRSILTLLCGKTKDVYTKFLFQIPISASFSRS